MSSINHRCIIIIPVYKPEMDDDETRSLHQCLKVLGQHPVAFVTPDALNCDQYCEICSQYGIRFIRYSFDKSFFAGIEGYNRLLLSRFFYESFAEYDYMLIYQLDAYVFYDELDKWCRKGFDYIGAPLIGDHSDEAFSMRMRVGNGGFSLRKIKTYMAFFDSRNNVFSGLQVSKRINLWKKPCTRLFVWFLMVLGWRNKPSTVAEGWKYNEDDFWSGLLTGTRYQLSVPEIPEAIRFSFERFPSELYEVNHRQLPFGCHAWKKYQYDSFWSEYIH